jgi:prepilin-type N-terminal cleavage/methylation domain-containing protein
MKQVKKGFTLIEVILVLAIAALIFLMVLLTLPAVQRAQRDMQRKEDVGKLIAAYTEFVGNNRGTQPGDSTDLCTGADGVNESTCEMNPYVRLTDGVSYTISAGPVANATIQPSQGKATTDNVAIYKQARCDVNGTVKRGDSSRQIAAVVELEGAGSDGTSIYYCQDS